jgi:hypothetical protein
VCKAQFLLIKDSTIRQVKPMDILERFMLVVENLTLMLQQEQACIMLLNICMLGKIQRVTKSIPSKETEDLFNGMANISKLYQTETS